MVSSTLSKLEANLRAEEQNRAKVDRRLVMSEAASAQQRQGLNNSTRLCGVHQFAVAGECARHARSLVAPQSVPTLFPSACYFFDWRSKPFTSASHDRSPCATQAT